MALWRVRNQFDTAFSSRVRNSTLIRSITYSKNSQKSKGLAKANIFGFSPCILQAKCVQKGRRVNVYDILPMQASKQAMQAQRFLQTVAYVIKRLNKRGIFCSILPMRAVCHRQAENKFLNNFKD